MVAECSRVFAVPTVHAVTGDSNSVFSGTDIPRMHPFYAAIGFCSHLPATPDSAVVSDVARENSADNVR
jgi:hypothetical protein